MSKIRMATAWLDGCSGCHMSILDMDERLIELAGRVDLVYSPYVDEKEYPADVDVALVEGAVSSDDDLHKIRVIRERTSLLVSLGDCAVTGNVPSMRNPFGARAILEHAYLKHADLNKQIPTEAVPTLFERALPIHNYIPVDIFVPGCPPSADLIYFILSELLEGRRPDISTIARFGA
jgi:NAD-reducing hydrogenase small subunit